MKIVQCVYTMYIIELEEVFEIKGALESEIQYTLYGTVYTVYNILYILCSTNSEEIQIKNSH